MLVKNKMRFCIGRSTSRRSVTITCDVKGLLLPVQYNRGIINSMAVRSHLKKMSLLNSVEYVHGSVTFTTDMAVMTLRNSRRLIPRGIECGVTDALLSNSKLLSFLTIEINSFIKINIHITENIFLLY